MLGPLGDGSALFSPASPPNHAPMTFPMGHICFLESCPLRVGVAMERHGGKVELSRKAAPLCSFHGGGKSKSGNFLELCHLARGPPEAGRDVRSALWIGQASSS